MSKTKKIIKWSLIGTAGLIVSVVLFGVWFMSLLPEKPTSAKYINLTSPSELSYLTENIIPNRGKILTVVTSTATMGSSEKSTGYELTELSRPYYVFEANGFEVDIASPLGGEPPVVIDKGDMKEFDYAFLNDPTAQRKVKQSLAIKDVVKEEYSAVYFVGGKGAMFDFPENEHIQSIIREYYESGKVVGAVCHGPAALVNVKLNNGQSLLSNKTISSFTNEEELLLIPDAEDIFPFLLQDQLKANGAEFNEGAMYLNNVSVDGNLVTGQNPWSTWSLAESIIQQLGYKPKKREISAEENSVQILIKYAENGYDDAKNMINHYANKGKPIDRELLAVHSLLAMYQLKIGKAVNLIRLLKYSNTFL